jgi:hypothetical protein
MPFREPLSLTAVRCDSVPITEDWPLGTGSYRIWVRVCRRSSARLSQGQ